MSYLVFARKFRPQTFDELVGQEPIATTLKNAIKQNRVPQNFLFSGPRGVGKTSTARILAKALNCDKGPTDTPCGKCRPCQEVTGANSLDVLEIDGASNRGIDEIRNLRETVKFKPSSGRVKIYIIDEVHMLTTEAFNALLKTLEEPPPHVKFVMATTESHKVPLTILSRCHRFNFKRIPVNEITEKLEEIAKAEKLKAEKNALFQIAKASEGSLRDAESLLDQLASFSDGKIKEEDVLLMLGLASEEIYFSVLEALQSKDAKRIFELINELHDGGRDLVQFAKGMLEIFRHLLLFQCAGEVKQFVEMSDEGIAGLMKRKDQFSRGELLLGLSILGNLQAQLRRNLAPPKLLVETALLKLIHLDGLKAIEDAAAPLSVSYAAPAASAQPSYTPSTPRVAPKTEPAYVPRPVEKPSIKPSGAKASAVPETASSTTTAIMDGPALSLNEVEGIWPRVIEYVKTKRMSVGIFLSESSPVEVAEAGVTLGLPQEFQFHKEMLEKNVNRQLIEEAFEVVAARKLRVQFAITRADKAERQAAPAGAAPETAASQDNSPLPEILTQAMDIFEGARIVKRD